MFTTIKVKKEVDIRSVLIDISPRYIGDSDEDDMPLDFPLLNIAEGKWQATVDIDSGKIDGWPAGDAREMHVKVCDAGSYHLLDAEGNKIASIENNYVPNDLIPGSYGDYVELSIDENGVITNWPEDPDVSAFFESDEG